MKQIFMMLIGVAAMTGFAAPTITVDRVQQRYPWNGVVDIDYTVSGIPANREGNDYQVSFEVTVGAVTTVPTNYLVYAACDLPVGNGSYRVAWDTAADGFEAFTDQASVKGVLTYAPVTKADADYIIIDISSGSSSTVYPTRFVRTTLPSSVFNKDLYKKNRFVMKRVPKGSFWMGQGDYLASLGGYRNGDVRSSDRMYVQLTQDYYLAIFETTATQYYKVAGGTASTAISPKTTVWCGTTIDSVVTTFTSRLTNRALVRGGTIGENFSLPTEAQWEYACRAGTRTSTYNGDIVTTQPQANTIREAICASNNNGGTGAVGRYAPNPWGFYDMYGNIIEWCSDFYGDYPTPPEGLAWNENNPLVDPKGPETGTIHCLRGGGGDSGWNVVISGLRQNYPGNPTTSNHYRNGFRVAMTVK